MRRWVQGVHERHGDNILVPTHLLQSTMAALESGLKDIALLRDQLEHKGGDQGSDVLMKPSAWATREVKYKQVCVELAGTTQLDGGLRFFSSCDACTNKQTNKHTYIHTNIQMYMHRERQTQAQRKN